MVVALVGNSIHNSSQLAHAQKLSNYSFTIVRTKIILAQSACISTLGLIHTYTQTCTYTCST